MQAFNQSCRQGSFLHQSFELSKGVLGANHDHVTSGSHVYHCSDVCACKQAYSAVQKVLKKGCTCKMACHYQHGIATFCMVIQMHMTLVSLPRNAGKHDASLIVGFQGRCSLNLTMHSFHVNSFVSMQMIIVVVQGLQQQQDAAKAQQAAQAGPRQPTDPRSQDPRLRPQQPHQQPGPPAPPLHPQHLDPQPALYPQGAPGETAPPAPPPGNPGDVEMKPSLEELKNEPGGVRAGTPPQVKQETKVTLCMSLRHVQAAWYSTWLLIELTPKGVLVSFVLSSGMCLSSEICVSIAGHLDLCSSCCKTLCLLGTQSSEAGFVSRILHNTCHCRVIVTVTMLYSC